jgi:hypothetical protein
MLLESGEIPDRMIFMNSGIYLTTEGSSVLDILRSFEQKGAVILSCTTCLDYYNRRDKLLIGEPTNMKDTVDTILEYDKVFTV